MESKANNNSHVFLFGFSFNLIITLGSLGFTCYSLQRLDSRLIAVEQNLRMPNPSSELGNRVNSLPTITHPRPRGAQMEEIVRVRRATDTSSLCRKCSNVCAKSNGNRSVSAISQFYTTISTNLAEEPLIAGVKFHIYVSWPWEFFKMHGNSLLYLC